MCVVLLCVQMCVRNHAVVMVPVSRSVGINILCGERRKESHAGSEVSLEIW